MLFEHEGRAPVVDPGPWVAPTAVLCGDVRVAAGARVLWNAVLVDDGGPVELRTVLGIERGAPAAQATRRHAELFGRHRDDTVVG